MVSDNFTRSVSLQCPTCGGTQFEYEAEAGPFWCVGCDRTIAKDDLLRENGNLIENHVDELASEAAKFARDHLRKSIRRATSASKHFKLK